MRRRREFYILNYSNTVLAAIVLYSLLIGNWFAEGNCGAAECECSNCTRSISFQLQLRFAVSSRDAFDEWIKNIKWKFI